MGEVQLLIGQDNADLLSIGGYGRNRINKLRVMECPHGSGFVLTGTHPTVKFNPCLLSEETRAIRNNIVVHRANINFMSQCRQIMPDLYDIPVDPP